MDKGNIIIYTGVAGIAAIGAIAGMAIGAISNSKKLKLVDKKINRIHAEIGDSNTLLKRMGYEQLRNTGRLEGVLMGRGCELKQESKGQGMTNPDSKQK